MNLQALMKQAQSMQKNIMDSKKKIDEMTFEIKSDELEKDDLEILEDMIKIATNDALKQIEKEVNDKLGSQAGALGGLL